jgi:hypothetical protein|tara:strand:+ start:5067 stop:5240 length:174 start_codon:yes stop_codon:yes gene_type:complete
MLNDSELRTLINVVDNYVEEIENFDSDIDEKEVVTILLKLEDMLTNRGVNVKSVCDS